ncbi:MAG: hypothetical protein ACE5G3_12150, partial [Gammaproteobacteria bacterium]
MTARAGTTVRKNRRATDLREPFLNRVAAAIGDETVCGIRVRQFIVDYYRDLDIADLRDEDPGRLAAAALAHLDFAMNRRPGRAKVRVYNHDEAVPGRALERTVIDVVNDNMPFLVDSISMAIAEMGFGIVLTVHPIFSVNRDDDGALTAIGVPGTVSAGARAESIARFEIQYVSSSAERKRLAQTIRDCLADVRAAVRDWRKMVGHMHSIIDDIRDLPPPIPRDVLDESVALLEWLADDNFTFLGYRRYELQPAEEPTELRPVGGTALGIPGRRGRKAGAITLTPQILRVIRARKLLFVTKANSRATV